MQPGAEHDPSYTDDSAWIARCAEAILEIDGMILPEDATELAQALCERSSCRSVDPAAAVRLLFEGRLSEASRRADAGG
jgi:hypothetical protein